MSYKKSFVKGQRLTLIQLNLFLVGVAALMLDLANHNSTRFITDAIDYLYGLVFAGCCAALFFIVFFFVIESKDRTLEEIDQMYIDRVNPINSAKYDTTRKRSNSRTNTPEE